MRDSFDQTLSAAFRHVPVPPGLAQRVIERLEAEQQDTQNRPRSLMRSLRRASRLSARWILVGGGLALVVAFLVSRSFTDRPGECFSESFVLDAAIRMSSPSGETSGDLMAEKNPPSDFPFSTAVLQVRGTRWRGLDGFLGRRGVVYDLPGPAGASASLFVVEADANEEFSDAPSLHPFTTAGCCASAWREGKLLYVLVVQGDPATYRAYLEGAQAPVAWQPVEKEGLAPNRQT